MLFSSKPLQSVLLVSNKTDKCNLSFLELEENTLTEIVCIYFATGINMASVGQDNTLESCLGHLLTYSGNQIKNAEDKEKIDSVLHCSWI